MFEKFDFKIFFKALIITVLLITVSLIYFGVKDKKSDDNSNETKFKNSTEFVSEGGGMRYSGFNKKHEKTLTVICEKSEITKDDKIIMKKMVASFTPKSRVKDRITISGDTGKVGNNLFNFKIEGNAKMQSDNFSVTSEYYDIKDRDVVTSNGKVGYVTKHLKGDAKQMIMHLKNSLVSFYDSKGFYEIDKKTYRFITARLHFNDNERVITFRKLKKKNEIFGDGYSLQGDRIIVKFSDDYKKRLYTHVIGSSNLLLKKRIENTDELDVKNIQSRYLEITYTDAGDIGLIIAKDHSKAFLKNQKFKINFLTNTMTMDFFEENQSVKSINLKGTYNDFSYKDLQDKGKDDFKLFGYEIDVLFDETGDISEWFVKDDKITKFISEKYYCKAKSMDFNAKNNQILLNKEAMLEIDKKNVFNSDKLIINTKLERLKSDSPVSAKIQLEKKSVLLSKNPIHINSDKMVLDDKKSKMKFIGNVLLLQNDVSIKTDKLVITKGEGIKCKSDKSSEIIFVDNEKEIIIKGGLILINSDKKTIDITEKAIIKDGENKIKGDNLIIIFDEKGIKEILGKGNIKFKKDELKIESESVNWNYVEELVFFEELKKIEKKQSGSVIGKRIKLNLKTNVMTVLSDENERTQTILE